MCGALAFAHPLRVGNVDWARADWDAADVCAEVGKTSQISYLLGDVSEAVAQSASAMLAAGSNGSSSACIFFVRLDRTSL